MDKVNLEAMTPEERTIWEYEKDLEMADLAGYPLSERLGSADVCR